MGSEEKPCWFVGACFGGKDDQVERFLANGIWEVNNPTTKEIALVQSMNAGERIAIKATYVRKHEVPFETNGHVVSVMAIKATGIITQNPGDGTHVVVEWTPQSELREWYLYTYQATIWRVVPGEPFPDGLIAFAFENTPQDIPRFINHPFWRERFGTNTTDKTRFAWTTFYESIAEKLVTYRSNRPPLVDFLRDLTLRVDAIGHLAEDQYHDGSTGFLRDICPFTTMALFNRGLTPSNRKTIAGELGTFLGVSEPVPENFDGIPLMNNQKSWFFPWEKDRPTNQIDVLWAVFAAGINYADSGRDEDKKLFEVAFDEAMAMHGVAWNLTFGLYWIRPWTFLPLDANSRNYVTQKLGVPIATNGPKNRVTGKDYLSLIDTITPRFQEESYPVHSYPELSEQAWSYKSPLPNTSGAEKVEETEKGLEGESISDTDSQVVPTKIISYGVEDILKDGCFLEREEIYNLVERLKGKRNLILQGPPGTGKTWLAKRVAFALIGEKDESRVRAVQFHPNLSYEDFVRGWRPTSDKHLSVRNGIFMEMVKKAAENSSSKFVLVIEEINRGNPAQIFGELLTLLEAGKRTPNEALELCYPDEDGSRHPVHIPDNLYVIGTMNIADRSLALVDLALRRRFAFVTLEPRLGLNWREWVVSNCNLDEELVEEIEKRFLLLNEKIAADPRLGKQFRIGHSYVTPPHPVEDGETKKWFQQAVKTEIGPLLEEYWFDAPEEANKAANSLLQEW